MKLEWKTCLKVGLSIFLLYLAIHYWSSVSGVLGAILSAATPIFVGLAIAYILNILMSFYERYTFQRLKKHRANPTLSRVVCMTAALLTAAGIVALVIGLVIPELIDCIRFLILEIPPLVDELLQQPWVAELIPADLAAALNELDLQAYLSDIVKVLGSGISGVVNTVFTALSSVFSSVIQILLSLIFAVYLLLSRDRLMNQGSRLLQHYLRPSWSGRIRHWLQVFNESFRRYIVGQCTEAVLLGVLCILGMLIFRFPYAVMIGTLVGFTALIPIAGAYIGAVVGAIMILTVSPLKALLFLIFLVVLQQLEGNLIYPRVVGKSLGLPAIWVLAAVTVGGGLMGILGMLLGVPITSALYRLVQEDLHRREAAADATAAPEA